jgi:hypothetical protein
MVQIQQAVIAGKARLSHGYRDASQGGSSFNTALDNLDGNDFDTRGDAFSVWEEIWTTVPSGINECLKLAKI